MSAAPCSTCGGLRKYHQVHAEDGWHMPACSGCGSPAWVQRHGDPDCTCEVEPMRIPCAHCVNPGKDAANA